MLTIREFCSFAKISMTHFYTLKAQGLGPDLTRLGKSVRITEQSAKEWIERHTEHAA